MTKIHSQIKNIINIIIIIVFGTSFYFINNKPYIIWGIIIVGGVVQIFLSFIPSIEEEFYNETTDIDKEHFKDIKLLCNKKIREDLESSLNEHKEKLSRGTAHTTATPEEYFETLTFNSVKEIKGDKK